MEQKCWQLVAVESGVHNPKSKVLPIAVSGRHLPCFALHCIA